MKINESQLLQKSRELMMMLSLPAEEMRQNTIELSSSLPFMFRSRYTAFQVSVEIYGYSDFCLVKITKTKRYLWHILSHI